jgi:hypothetical protein
MSNAHGVPHQCPRCELRFVTVNELGSHLRVEHDGSITLGDPAAPHIHTRRPVDD